MKLTQALGKSSLVVDGSEDNNITSNPDENSGFGLDTWDNETIKMLFSVIPKEEEYNMKKGVLGGRGVSVYHRFTKEHCEKILEKLKSFEKKEVEYEGRKVEVVFLANKNKGLLIKWFQRLIDLFSDFNDLPVYYWCD
jgi:hypothetical protein